jgi:hypothetical protein
MNAPVVNIGDTAMVACHSEMSDESFRAIIWASTENACCVQNLCIPWSSVSIQKR